MPWNFPFWQVFRFAAPALMAGNAGILKHASNVPGCALGIERVFREAGFPDNLFRYAAHRQHQVDAVIAHPLVRAVTLTGSTPAGKAVAKKAGEMLKKTVFELGGSDAYVILADADLDAAVATCVASRLINAGQSALPRSGSSWPSLFAEFERHLSARRSGDLGDPPRRAHKWGRWRVTTSGTNSTRRCRQSIANGASLSLVAAFPRVRGLLPADRADDVRPGMPAYDDELFGPVAAIITVPDERKPSAWRTSAVFGLGAAVFTQDLAKGERIAATELEAGCCFVNTFVKSDPRLPFGGVKESGYGRELSYYGIKEFVNIKTVFVK